MQQREGRNNYLMLIADRCHLKKRVCFFYVVTTQKSVLLNADNVVTLLASLSDRQETRRIVCPAFTGPLKSSGWRQQTNPLCSAAFTAFLGTLGHKSVSNKKKFYATGYTSEESGGYGKQDGDTLA